ncbi:HAD family hydrolase [Lysinibacillus fusiformis]|nr:HAD family hydrolase [Lysinibacillus fusiformis]
MKNYRFILFDLDGTLTDPKVGITKSVQYALHKMNIVEQDLEKLTCFIGPPLQVSFKEYYGFDEEQTKSAIDYYRERFKEQGIFENELYEGILPLVQLLNEQQYRLVVATSKPTVFAEQILKHFELESYFDLIVGSNLDGTRSSKADIIRFILDYYKGYGNKDFVMIGDRKHDIIGANDTHIDSIAVSYGYGSMEELIESNPTQTAESVEQLKELLV